MPRLRLISFVLLICGMIFSFSIAAFFYLGSEENMIESMQRSSRVLLMRTVFSTLVTVPLFLILLLLDRKRRKLVEKTVWMLGFMLLGGFLGACLFVYR